MITKITCSLRGFGTVYLKIIKGTVTVRDGYYYAEVLEGTLDYITMSKQNFYFPMHCTIIVEDLS
jgi:hypothetical protein